jgi:hypothetical protein
MARRTNSAIGTPRTGCRHLGKEDRIRFPFPAANMIPATCSITLRLRTAVLSVREEGFILTDPQMPHKVALYGLFAFGSGSVRLGKCYTDCLIQASMNTEVART